MRRRRFLSAAVLVAAGLTGGIGTTEVQNEPQPPSNDSVAGSVKERVKTCETDYIKSQLFADGREAITTRSGPFIREAESTADGVLLTLETEISTIRSIAHQPDENNDYLVTATYRITEETVYRTEGFIGEGTPRNGTTVDC